MLRAVLSSVTAPPREAPPEVAPPPSAPDARAPRRFEGIDRWRLAPVAIVLALSVVEVAWAPRLTDMAAHVFRAELFGREGLSIWNGQWYGGHHTPAYSIIGPPLAWLLGPRLVLALASIASAGLFEAIVHRHFGPERARWGAIWFAIGTVSLLFTGRMPFAIGVAFALGAVLAMQRGRRKLAYLSAFLSPLGSPVAGLFLALVGLAYALAQRRKRPDLRLGLGVAVAALAPPVFLSAAFPEGGWAPFPISSYLPIPLFALLCLVVIPRRESALRWGAALYGAGATLAVVLATPMGGNAVRLGALFGGPVLLCVLAGTPLPRRRTVLVPLGAILAALAWWQCYPAVRDVVRYVQDPAAKADYFKPLKEFLATLPDQRRIEIPFTRSHWESAEIAPDVPLARGWLRQLDTGRNPVFYKGPLNRLTYASWLAENAVRYVALPGAKPDSSSYRERALIESGLPYLKLRWRSQDWRVYEVILPAPFVIPRGNAKMTLEQLGSDRVLLRVNRPGEALVRVRYTPYWLAHGGCVEKAGNWTRVTAFRQGFLELTTRFSPERIFDRGRRCDGGS